jgi:FMN phosphatase YigB (HAD superfamily)
MLYFDLGNVLVRFDPQRACTNVAKLAGCSPSDAHRVIYESGLETRYERGDLNDPEFANAVCEGLNCRIDTPQLLDAVGRMFELHAPTVPFVLAAEHEGLRLGILSNTCGAHWEWIARQRWGLFAGTFSVHALSYRLGTLKPERRIYEVAAELAGLEPSEIAFVDDRIENVTAASEAGWLAVPFHNPWQAARELRAAGLRLPM